MRARACIVIGREADAHLWVPSGLTAANSTSRAPPRKFSTRPAYGTADRAAASRTVALEEPSAISVTPTLAMGLLDAGLILLWRNSSQESEGLGVEEYAPDFGSSNPLQGIDVASAYGGHASRSGVALPPGAF